VQISEARAAQLRAILGRAFDGDEQCGAVAAALASVSTQAAAAEVPTASAPTLPQRGLAAFLRCSSPTSLSPVALLSLQVSLAKKLHAHMLEHEQQQARPCAAGSGSTESPSSSRALADLLVNCELVAPRLCAASPSPTVLPTFRAACWSAATLVLARWLRAPTAGPLPDAVIAAARLVPALVLVEAAYLQRERDRVKEQHAAALDAWRVASEARAAAASAQQDALTAAGSAVDEDADGILADAPTPASRANDAPSAPSAAPPSPAGGPVYFPLPVPPALTAFLAAKGLAAVRAAGLARQQQQREDAGGSHHHLLAVVGGAWDGRALAGGQQMRGNGRV
jgi:hypothetical protein